MKYFAWSVEKDASLRKERGISFEEIVYHLDRGDVAAILEHTNQKRYPGQRVLVVIVDEYAFLVPCIETEEEVFLKTIILSRKATKEYLGEK